MKDQDRNVLISPVTRSFPVRQLHEVTCTTEACKKQMSGFRCRCAVKPSVTELNRKVQAEDDGDTLLKGWMPTLCLFFLLLSDYKVVSSSLLSVKWLGGENLAPCTLSFGLLWSSLLWKEGRPRLVHLCTCWLSTVALCWGSIHTSTSSSQHVKTFI